MVGGSVGGVGGVGVRWVGGRVLWEGTACYLTKGIMIPPVSLAKLKVDSLLRGVIDLPYWIDS